MIDIINITGSKSRKTLASGFNIDLSESGEIIFSADTVFVYHFGELTVGKDETCSTVRITDVVHIGKMIEDLLQLRRILRSVTAEIAVREHGMICVYQRI